MAHHIVTDQEFYEALPPGGLALAKQQAEEYLENAQLSQDGDYPVKDVVNGLFIIDGIQTSQQDGTASA